MKAVSGAWVVVFGGLLSCAFADPPPVPTPPNLPNPDAVAAALINAHANPSTAAIYPPSDGVFNDELGVFTFTDSAFSGWLGAGWTCLPEESFDFYSVILFEAGTTIRTFAIRDLADLTLAEPATPPTWDPAAWAEAAYGPPPEWLDPGALQDWYTLRDP